MSDAYELEAAKTAIHTLQRQLAAARELAESNGKLAHNAAIDAMRYRDQLKIAVDALTQIRDSDWLMTIPDRIDAVREIARQTIAIVKGGGA